MKNTKKILFGLLSIIIIVAIGLSLYLSQIDSRFSGTFRSDVEKTMSYIKSMNKYSPKQIKIFEQMFGYLIHEINGHTIKIITREPYTIQDYPEGSSTKIEKSVAEFPYIMIKRTKDKAVIIEIPSPFWDINSANSFEIEFDDNGYWISTPSGVREKFKKIKS